MQRSPPPSANALRCPHCPHTCPPETRGPFSQRPREDLSETKQAAVTPPLGELLARLPGLVSTAKAAEEDLHSWVQMLRERRASWTEIGEALQVSRQAAWERFGKRVPRAGDNE